MEQLRTIDLTNQSHKPELVDPWPSPDDGVNPPELPEGHYKGPEPQPGGWLIELLQRFHEAELEKR